MSRREETRRLATAEGGKDRVVLREPEWSEKPRCTRHLFIRARLDVDGHPTPRESANPSGEVTPEGDFMGRRSVSNGDSAADEKHQQPIRSRRLGDRIAEWSREPPP